MDDQGNDWPDNHLRFARLCLAAAEIAGGRGAQAGNRAWCTPTTGRRR